MNILTRTFPGSDLSRRSFVESLAKATLGVSLLPYGLQAAGSKSDFESTASLPGFGKAKNLIWLQMIGGMTHIDTFDPKSGSTKGASSAISTKGGFQISSYLPKLADRGDDFAIIRSMSSKTGVHASGQYLMRTGYEERGTIKHPCMGAWAQTILGPSHKTLPSSVCVSRNPDHGNGFFAASYSPLPVHDPESGLQYAMGDAGEEVMHKRMTLLNDLDKGFRTKFQDVNLKAYSEFYDNTLELMASADLKAFKLAEESNEVRQSYGGTRNKFGQGCLLARRLIQNGVRSVEVAMGGWDMHNDIDTAMKANGNNFDQAVAGLLGDLKSHGLLSSTIVVVCSEFGRTPTVNGRGGRDHYPKVFSTMLAGGGIKGGTVYGSSDKDGREVADKQTTIQDFHATVGHAMGMEPAKVVMSPSGRPFTIANKGHVVADLFA